MKIKSVLVTLTAVASVFLSSCDFWPVETHVSCIIHDGSRSEILIISSEADSVADSTIVLSGGGSGIFGSHHVGELGEPSESVFAELGDYMEIYITDSLIYNQEPLDKAAWRLITSF